MKAINGLDIQKKKPQSQQDIFFNKKIVSPEKLKILVLSGNDIVSEELQFIHRCTNLLKLDLSNNHITKLSIKIGMQNLRKLEILYLHHNKIENAVGLEGVFTLPKLTHLTIRDNPIQRLPRIQHLIVNVVPTLKILGERVVFVQERSPSFFQTRKNVFIEPQISEGWKIKDNIQSQYIKVLQLQLRYFDNVWVHSNPIVFIQRMWRQCLQHKRYKKLQLKKKLNKRSAQQSLTPQNSQIISNLKQYFQQWKQYAASLKSVKKALRQTSGYPQDKNYLTLPLKDYQTALRNIRVQMYVKNYVEHIRHKIFVRRAAEKITRQLRRKVVQFSSAQAFFSLCHIQKTKRIYFNKTQTHLLQNFLLHLQENFKWDNQIKKVCKIGQVTHYLSIRTVDPQTFSVKTMYSTLTYSMWPSMRAIFLKKKKFESKQKTGLLKIKPLYYIKNQNKNLTKQEFKKSNKIYKRLQKFYKKQYENSLDYFQCKDDEIMKMLLRYIYYHNTKTFKFQKKLNKNDMQSLLQNYQEPFLMYVESILERTAAAVRIQQNWRKYLVNKNSKQSIYVKMKKTRAVLRIQRFWRDRIFYHRLNFQKHIALNLKFFNLTSFFIPCQIYLKMVQKCQQGNELYDNLFLVKCLNKKLLKAVWSMTKPVTSPIIADKHFPTIQQANSRTSLAWDQCDPWNILHFNSNISKIQYMNKQFYEIKFETLEQTKYRIYLLALLTYKCKGSTFFLPISKDGLDLINIRYDQYVKVKLVQTNPFQNTIDKKIKSKTSLKIKQDRSFINDKKIITIKHYKQNGIFLTNQEQLLKPKLSYQINLQFYQKIYQDFPKKFTMTAFYCLPNDIQKQKIQQKQKNIQELISERIDVNNEIQKINQRKTIRSNVSERNNQKQLNVTKIDKKRLSLYQFGGKSSVVRKNVEKPGTSGELSLNQYVLDRRQNISRIKVQQSTRKQQTIQKRTANLKKIRQDLQKQRSLHLTHKNMKQIQRTEQLKKKIQRIKQMKNRVSSLKKQDHQQDFVQQGNFVMEQQLKMVIMRNKIQANQIKKKEKQRSETVSVSSKKNGQQLQKSFFTEQRNNQIKVFQNGPTKNIAQSLGATLQINNPTQQTIQGEQRKIVNIRSQKRNKSRSIGAYMRDPSLVHGVFPQEYYPIQTKANTAFKFFPSLHDNR